MAFFVRFELRTKKQLAISTRIEHDCYLALSEMLTIIYLNLLLI